VKLGRQFDPSQVGPAEAKLMDPARSQYLNDMGREHRHRNPQLFSVEGSEFMLEPHQQTRSQFAADPRTWWHGRYGEQLPRTGGAKNAGIHVGSFGAADKRRRDLGPSHKFPGTYDEGPQPWRSFPVRLKGETTPNWQGPGGSPANPAPDEGNRWSPKEGVHYYRNAVEDSGSISALAPSRQFLQTHGEAVKAAGAKAHPLIRWEQKQLGRREYDPERVDPGESRLKAFRATQSSALDQGQLFSTAPYNQGSRERADMLFNRAFMPSHGGTG